MAVRCARATTAGAPMAEIRDDHPAGGCTGRWPEQGTGQSMECCCEREPEPTVTRTVGRTRPACELQVDVEEVEREVGNCREAQVELNRVDQKLCSDLA